MKRKTIIITGILILTLLAVTGYFLYPYYVKQKTISEKTAEINTIEKDFKNSTDRESRLVQRIINNCYIKPMPLPLH